MRWHRDNPIMPHPWRPRAALALAILAVFAGASFTQLDRVQARSQNPYPFPRSDRIRWHASGRYILTDQGVVALSDRGRVFQQLRRGQLTSWWSGISWAEKGDSFIASVYPKSYLKSYEQGQTLEFVSLTTGAVGGPRVRLGQHPASAPTWRAKNRIHRYCC